MGIYIHESISKGVTKEEWGKVYQETLTLMKAFPFAERGNITYAGRKVACTVPAQEREAVSFQGDRMVGWNTTGDYDTLKGAENYYIPKDLVGDGAVEAEPWDAMMEALPAYLDLNWEDDMFGHTYSLWDSKTQGEPYHMYILAVACLIEDRLGNQAFTYGDITRGQCQKAVELANQHLEKPIRVPARCEMERLFQRIQNLPIGDTEKVSAFEKFYLGAQDESFIAFEQAHFPKEAILGRWKKQFSGSGIQTVGFSRDLKKYLSLGLGLEELCGIVELEDSEGKPQYEAFLKAVMDSKLHLQEKNTKDYLDIQPEDKQSYAIWSLLANFVFCSAHNHKVGRYIPIEEIRESLKKGIGEGYDVDAYITQYLKEEADAPKVDIEKPNLSKEELAKMVTADASEAFTQTIEKYIREDQKEQEQYDIINYGDLLYYRKGNAVKPGLMKALGGSFQFYHGTLQEEHYKSLMAQDPRERCLFLIEQNQHLMLRDCDWMRIFSEIEGNPESFGRYYPMVRVKMDSDGLYQMVQALVLNDELYAYAEEVSHRVGEQ